MFGAPATPTFACTKSYCYGDTPDVEAALVTLQKLAIELGAPIKPTGRIDSATVKALDALTLRYPDYLGMYAGSMTMAFVTASAGKISTALVQILNAQAAAAVAPRWGAYSPTPTTEPKLGPPSVTDPRMAPSPPPPPAPPPPVFSPAPPELPPTETVATSTGVPLPAPPAPEFEPATPTTPAVSLATMTMGAKLAIGFAVVSVLGSILGLAVVKRRRRARVA